VTTEKDGYEVARSLLDGGPDIAVQDFMLLFMQFKKNPLFMGCSFDPDTGIMRVTDGIRSAIYREVERRGEMVRMRWPD
jgi:hypothetical protein